MKTTQRNTFSVTFQGILLILALFMGATSFAFAEQPSPQTEPVVTLTFNPQTEPVKPTLIIQSLWEQMQEQREQRKQQQNPNNEADSTAELMEQPTEPGTKSTPNLQIEEMVNFTTIILQFLWEQAQQQKQPRKQQQKPKNEADSTAKLMEQLSPILPLLKMMGKSLKANPPSEQDRQEASRQLLSVILKSFLGLSIEQTQMILRMAELYEQYEEPGNQPEFQLLVAKLLAISIGYEPSSVDSFDILVKHVFGQNCEKTDEDIQQPMRETLKKVVRSLKGYNQFMFTLSKWMPQADTVERMMNLSPRPMTSTQIPSNEVIDKAIKSVIPITDEMLAATKRICGDHHIRVARGLYALSELYRAQADYERTKTLLIKTKQILITGYPKHSETAAIYANLGVFYALIGDYPNAKNELVQAVELANSLETLGPNHPNTITGLQNLIGVYIGLGDYANAELLIEKSLNALDNLKVVTESDFQIWYRELMRLLFYKPDREVQQRQSIAYASVLLGDYETAKRQFNLALTLLKQKNTLPSFEEVASHHGLGWTYQQQGDHTKAEVHYRQALENISHFVGSANSILLLATQVNLGYLYYLQGEHVKAEQVLQKAVDSSPKLSLPEGVRELSRGMILYDLGLFYQWTQQFEKAETHLQEALTITTDIFGQKHPSVVEMTQNLIALQFDRQQIVQAVMMAKALQPDSENVLKHILSFGTEQQRLAYQKRSYPYDLLARVANETGEAMPLANAILHNKGIVLDSLMEDYQLAGSPEIKDKMLSLKGQLMMLMMTFHQDNSDSAKIKRAHQREKLERQLKQLESGLAQQVGEARQAFEVNVERVQQVLPKDSVLVEFIRYKHFVGRQDRQAYYGAVIIPSKGQPIWAALGKADAIESQIVAYQQMMRCKDEVDCPKYDEERVTHILQTLYQSIWAPIEKTFPKGIKTIILSPDGELNFVSFATLLTPNNDFLVQQFDLYYVASGRDLLRKPKSTEQPTMMIYALDNWNQSSVVAKTRGLVNEPMMSSIERQAYLNLPLSPLGNTISEANELKKMAQSKNWTVKTFVNSQATEKPLYKLEPSPRILHFATHGVFLQPKPEKFVTDFLLTSSGTQYMSPLKFLSNPMRRSFIALAGAQTTLDAWKVGDAEKLPNPINDGILTAEEVSSLKLENTWLTMFSACETGRGEGRSGEGVLGLRRGFVQAGTQNLLMTLWPYKDGVDEIVDFEVEFYEKAIKTKNAPKALNDVQRQWLLDVWMDGGITGIDSESENEIEIAPLLDSVRFFGPFVMSFQGPLGK